MGTVRYTVVNGEVLSENRNGTLRDYVPDPLGNTVALLDNTQTKTDTWDYWPFGEVKTRTGATATPFQNLGTLGYFRDSATRNYVRKRILDVEKGRWLTPDTIGGGDANLFRYVSNRPVRWADPSGMVACYIDLWCSVPIGRAVLAACRVFDSHRGRNCVLDCIRSSLPPGLSVDRYFNCLRAWCRHPRVDLLCCRTVRECGSTRPGPVPGCAIGVCTNSCPGSGSWCDADYERCITIIHEALHCCHRSGDVVPPGVEPPWVEAIATCIGACGDADDRNICM